MFCDHGRDIEKTPYRCKIGFFRAELPDLAIHKLLRLTI